MRESFGGAFMIKLVLVFIVIYISFMAVAVNYAKAFRVKNNVINILEQYQYTGKDGEEAIIQIQSYLSDVGYNVDNSSVSSSCSGENNKNVNGVCIVSLGTDSDPYYRVTSYISIEFPFFSIYMTLPVSGETKIIH